jgi:hypothetical protein
MEMIRTPLEQNRELYHLHLRCYKLEHALADSISSVTSTNAASHGDLQQSKIADTIIIRSSFSTAPLTIDSLLQMSFPMSSRFSFWTLSLPVRSFHNATSFLRPLS